MVVVVGLNHTDSSDVDVDGGLNGWDRRVRSASLVEPFGEVDVVLEADLDCLNDFGVASARSVDVCEVRLGGGRGFGRSLDTRGVLDEAVAQVGQLLWSKLW